MVVGQLVRCEDGFVGTIVKSTRYSLGPNYQPPSLTPAPIDLYSIKPGFVVTVRWQKDLTKPSTHVFYDGCSETLDILHHGNCNISLVEEKTK